MTSWTFVLEIRRHRRLLPVGDRDGLLLLSQLLMPRRERVRARGKAFDLEISFHRRDREKRRMMAQVSAKLADFSVITAEDPRTESLDGILQEMADGCISQGGVEGKTFMRVPDRGAALYEACRVARAGDLVIACGKGHEQSMAFGSTEYPWDDRDALRAALHGKPLTTLPTAQ